MSATKHYRDLHIEKELIVYYIGQACSEYSSIKLPNNFPSQSNSVDKWKAEIEVENKKAILEFFFKKDNTISINANLGKNKDISVKIAEYIESKDIYIGAENKPFRYIDIEESDFNLLIEFLENCGAKKMFQKENEANYIYQVKFLGALGDQITLTYFKSKLMLLQGKVMWLYQEVVCFMSQIISEDEVIQKSNEAVNEESKPQTIRDKMTIYLPDAYSKLDETIKKMLSPCFVYKDSTEEFEDYSSWTIPALRALEATMKDVFLRKSIPVGGHFEQFEPDNNVYKLKEWVKCKITCNNLQTSLENGYNYYYQHRHTLSHANTVVSSSRIIENKAEALIIINKSVKFINETYKHIK